MGAKVHINYICQPDKQGPMFNHWCLIIDWFVYKYYVVSNEKDWKW
jgi:hypothetical protein